MAKDANALHPPKIQIGSDHHEYNPSKFLVNGAGHIRSAG